MDTSNEDSGKLSNNPAVRLHYGWFLLLALIPGLLVALEGCNPPEQSALDQCQNTAAQRAKGRNLDPTDLGELIEECMSNKGFALDKDSNVCHHDSQSASKRTCYYSNSLLGRVFHR